MKEDKNKGSLPTKFSLAIRIAVGLYLFYTVYSLRGVTEKYDGGELAFFIIAMAAFAVIGAFLCIHSARALMTGRFADGAEEASAGEPEGEDDLKRVPEETQEAAYDGKSEDAAGRQEMTEDETAEDETAEDETAEDETAEDETAADATKSAP